MKKEKTLLERMADSIKELDKWPKARREAALREARAPASYQKRLMQAMEKKDNKNE